MSASDADRRRLALTILDRIGTVQTEYELSVCLGELRACPFFTESPAEAGELLLQRLRGATATDLPVELWLFAAHVFFLAGDPKACRTLLDQAFSEDLEGVNPTDVADGHITLGMLEARHDRWEQAVVAWEEAVKLLPPNSPHEPRLRKLLGQGWEALGAGDRAMANLQEALKSAARTDSLETECEMLSLLGDHCRTRNLMDQAASYYLMGIDRARDGGHPLGESAAQLGYGDLCLELGELEEARRALAGGLSAARDAEDRLLQAVALLRLSELARREGRYDDARAKVEEGIFVAKGSATPVALASLHHQLGLVHESAGRTTLAITAYEKAADERRLADDPGGLGATLNNLGALYHTAGDVDAARSCYREAIVAFNDAGPNRREAAVVVENLRRLDESATNDPPAATSDRRGA